MSLGFYISTCVTQIAVTHLQFSTVFHLSAHSDQAVAAVSHVTEKSGWTCGTFCCWKQRGGSQQSHQQEQNILCFLLHSSEEKVRFIRSSYILKIISEHTIYSSEENNVDVLFYLLSQRPDGNNNDLLDIVQDTESNLLICTVLQR